MLMSCAEEQLMIHKYWMSRYRVMLTVTVISHLLPNEVLQYRALPSTLTADHCDLRKVQVGILSDGREGVLQSVYQRNQVLHSPIAHLVGINKRLYFTVNEKPM